jgi:cytochrome c551/c552
MATAPTTPIITLKQLSTQLHHLRIKIEQHHNSRRQQRSLKPAVPADHQDLTNIPTSPAVQQFFGAIMKAVQADQNRLFPATAPFAASQSALPPLPAAAHELVPDTVGPALKNLAQNFLQTQPFLPKLRNTAHPGPNCNPEILAFLQAELAWLSDSTTQARAATPAALLVKLRQAVQAYEEGRTTDTLTLLKKILNGDPHNHTLLACLSQILYAIAAAGTLTTLPEAREYAQRSIIASEKQRPPRLEIYQYLAVVTERAYGEERALEWLRSSGLLYPAMLQTQEGLLASRGAFVRAWAILATINPALWAEAELSALHDMVLQVVGGGAMYLHWLRAPLLQKLAASKVPDPLARQTEAYMLESWHTFSEFDFTWRNFPLQHVPNPWLLKVRYLQTLAHLLPNPAFDVVLCQISLDAQTWRDGTYPEREAQATLDDSTVSYWRLWAQTLSVKHDQRKNALFPAQEVLEDSEYIAAAEQILAQLHQLERQLIKPEAWEDLKPWLTRWQPEHLLAAATGSNQPRSRFAPTALPFSSFYRKWQEPQVATYQASEVIGALAKRGAFASWQEAIAALEGALRLSEDPLHGLIAAQRRAFELGKKQSPQKFANKHFTFGKPSNLSLTYSLVPIGLLGAIFAAFALSENISQAIGVSLALVGMGGVILLNSSRT